MLTQAFMEDPLYAFVLPEAGRRRKALMWLHRRLIHYCSLYGRMHTLPSLPGIACWLPPGRTDVTIGRILRTGLFAMPLYLGLGAFLRFNAYMSLSDGLREQHAPGNFWYLWVLAVDPASQGQGVGSRLMQPVMDEANAGNTPCFLETENEKNLGFYERHGFQVAASDTVPRSSVKTWSMIRMPRAS